ncbi:ATP synthase F1 subunit epsilon [Planctomycetota bacterium]
MRSNIRCIVITPEAQAVDAEAFDVVLPAYDGSRGILAGHAPLLCRLGVGLLRYRDLQNHSYAVFIEGGFGHVRDNEVTILTRSALTAADLTAAEAQEQLRQAEALPTLSIDEVCARRAAIHRAKQLVILTEKQS